MTRSADTPALLDNQAGDCRILPGGGAYCTGVVPNRGFEIVRVLLRPWLPIERGYAFIESYLKSVGRPVQALCGTELRVPAPLSFDQWSTFNVPYLAQLRKWGLMFGDLSGVCRSNIALAVHAPATTSLCAFSYTAPASTQIPTVCLSGTADIGADGKIIAEGDTGPAAMQKRARYTIETIGASLAKLQFSWEDTTEIAIFHVHDMPDLWGASLLGAVGGPVRRGVLVYRARPPIAGAEVELEARAVRQQLVVPAS